MEIIKPLKANANAKYYLAATFIITLIFTLFGISNLLALDSIISNGKKFFDEILRMSAGAEGTKITSNGFSKLSNMFIVTNVNNTIINIILTITADNAWMISYLMVAIGSFNLIYTIIMMIKMSFGYKIKTNNGKLVIHKPFVSITFYITITIIFGFIGLIYFAWGSLALLTQYEAIVVQYGYTIVKEYQNIALEVNSNIFWLTTSLLGVHNNTNLIIKYIIPLIPLIIVVILGVFAFFSSMFVWNKISSKIDFTSKNLNNNQSNNIQNNNNKDNYYNDNLSNYNDRNNYNVSNYNNFNNPNFSKPSSIKPIKNQNMNFSPVRASEKRSEIIKRKPLINTNSGFEDLLIANPTSKWQKFNKDIKANAEYFYSNTLRLFELSQNSGAPLYKKMQNSYNNLLAGKLDKSLHDVQQGIIEYIKFSTDVDRRFVSLLVQTAQTTPGVFSYNLSTINDLSTKYEQALTDWNLLEAEGSIEQLYAIAMTQNQLLAKVGYCIKYRLANDYAFINDQLNVTARLDAARDSRNYKEYRDICSSVISMMSPMKVQIKQFIKTVFDSLKI